MSRRLAFRPGDTLLHRLHPLVKAAYLLAGTVAVFAAPSAIGVLAVLAGTAGALALARVLPGELRGGRLVLITGVALGLLQLALVDDGDAVAYLGPWCWTDAGIDAALKVGGRFVAVVLLSQLYVLTTDPAALAHALMRAGLPYRWGFALTTALRLVAVFEREGRVIHEAQLARGLRLDAGSPLRLLRLPRALLLPLLVSALGKVDALAASMEGRGFGRHRDRTYLTPSRLGLADAVALGLLAVLVAAAVAGRGLL